MGQETSLPKFSHFINQPQPRIYRTKPYVWYWPVVLLLCYQPIISPPMLLPLLLYYKALCSCAVNWVWKWMTYKVCELGKFKCEWQCFSRSHSQIQSIVFWGTLVGKWRERVIPFFTKGTGWKVTDVKVPYKMRGLLSLDCPCLWI